MKAIQVPMASGGVVLIAVSEEVESDSEQTMGGTIARGKLLRKQFTILEMLVGPSRRCASLFGKKCWTV